MKLMRFSDVDVDDIALGGVVHDTSTGLYDALLDHPVTFVSNSLRALDAPDNDVLFVEVQEDFLEFVRMTEETLKVRTCAKKSEMFPGKQITDEAIRARFKSYITDANVLRLRLKPTAPVFTFTGDKGAVEDIKKNTRLRAVLTLGKLTIGRTEFGVVWEAEQVRLKEVPKEEDPVTEEPVAHDFANVCVIDDACSEVGEALPTQVRVVETSDELPKPARGRPKKKAPPNDEVADETADDLPTNGDGEGNAEFA